MSRSFFEGWMMGLEPTTLGTTIRCSTSCLQCVFFVAVSVNKVTQSHFRSQNIELVTGAKI